MKTNKKYPDFYRRDKNTFSVMLSDNDVIEIQRFPGQRRGLRMVRTENPLFIADTLNFQVETSKEDFFQFYEQVKSDLDILQLMAISENKFNGSTDETTG